MMKKSYDRESVEAPLLLNQQARILFRMTGRQLLVLAYALAICYVVWQSIAVFHSPVGLFLLVCGCMIPAVLIAFLKIGNKPLEQWLFVILLWMLTPEYLTRDRLVQTFVKLRRIEEGVVALDLDGKGSHLTYRAMIAVTSQSFDLLDSHEQAASVESFRKLLDGLSYPVTIQIRVLPHRPAALSSTIIPIQLDGRLRRFHAHYLSFLSRVVQQMRPVRMSFFLIIPTDQQGKEQAKEQLRNRVQELSRQCARAGLSCRALSSHELFTFYHEGFLPQPQERLLGTPPEVLLQDSDQLSAILAPSRVSIAASWLHVEGQRGGSQYLACLALEQLPRKLQPGWLHRVLEVNEPYLDISLHIVPQESDVVANQLRKRAVVISGALLAAKQGHDEETGSGNTITRYAIKDIERVRDQLVRKDTHLHLITLLFLVRGASRQELSTRIQRIQLALRGQDFQVATLRFQQYSGYFSSLGYGQNILSHYSHLLPTEVVATFYPFMASPTMDRGVFLGVTPNGNLVSIDLDDPEELNTNLAILGAPGSGKSFFFKVLLSRVAPRTTLSVIDIEDEYKRFIEAIGGQRVELNADSLQINPLEMGKEHTFREKVTMVIGFLSLLVGEHGVLTQHESGILYQSVLRAYQAAGITADPGTYGNVPPTMQDVAIILEQVEPGSDLSLRLASYLHLFPRRTCIPKAQHIVYSLKRLPELLQPVATYLITQQLWSELVTTPGALRHIVVVDEAWFLSKFASGAALLNEFARRIRKYHGGLWLGTQQLRDLLTSEEGKNLLALCEKKMLFKQDVSSSDIVRDVLHLSEEQAKYLRTARQGEALYMTSKGTLAVEILASERETAMAVTTQQSRREI